MYNTYIIVTLYREYHVWIRFGDITASLPKNDAFLETLKG